MKRTALALIFAAATSLALAGCGGGKEDSAAAVATVTTTTTTTTTAAPAPTVATRTTDEAGRGNCIAARLAYSPIRSGLSGTVDLEAAVSYFSAPDLDPATSANGKAAATAITEANYELALDNANSLAGQPIDRERLRALLDDVDAACSAFTS